MLPIPKRMNADPERLGELSLSESDEPTERDNVVPAGDPAVQDSFALFPWNRASEIPIRQFANVISGV